MVVLGNFLFGGFDVGYHGAISTITNYRARVDRVCITVIGGERVFSFTMIVTGNYARVFSLPSIGLTSGLGGSQGGYFGR